MKIFLGLVVWGTLAVIGASMAGFFGFLGVGFLYVLYYALLKPRVVVHTTREEMIQAQLAEESRNAATNAVLLDAAAKALRGGAAAKPKTVAEDFAEHAEWICSKCEAPNATSRTVCTRCGRKQ